MEQERDQYAATAAPKAHRTKLVVQIVERFSKQADAYEELLNKITYCLGVFCFGALCYVMGSRPQIMPSLYCAFFLSIVPMRWLYYRTRKWHYYLLDFCYYANVIFMLMLLLFPNNERMFMLCFSFSEGPLAWAIIVWRCSLVFNSIDKIISVIIHLLPGTVFFIIRWWDPITYSPHAAEATGPWPAWPVVQDPLALWTWLFIIPLAMYTVWQVLYFLVVNVLKKQRLLGDPEVMTSFRELARKAKRANNIWWRLSGLLGDSNRMFMYAVLQGAFTVATMALAVPIFMSYWLHVAFEIFKVMVAVWNGGKWLFEVMPRQFEQKRRGISETMVTVSSAEVEKETSRSKNNIEPCDMCKQLSTDMDFKRVLEEVMKQMHDSRSQAEIEDNYMDNFHNR